jgi:mRNA interferase HigB
MQVVNPKVLERFWRQHPDSRSWLERWLATAQQAAWRDIQQVRADYRATDGVRMESGRIVTVFDVCGNKHRLVTTILYGLQTVYVWEVLTHAEYGKGLWKRKL